MPMKIIIKILIIKKKIQSLYNVKNDVGVGIKGSEIMRRFGLYVPHQFEHLRTLIMASLSFDIFICTRSVLKRAVKSLIGLRKCTD